MKIHKRTLKIETLTSRELMAADTGFATSEPSALEAAYGVPLFDKDSAMARMSTSLVNLFLQEQNDSNPSDQPGSGDSLIRRNGDLVAVDLIARTDTKSLIKDSVDLGLTAFSSFGRIVSGWVPVSSLGLLSALDSLKFVLTGTLPILSKGAATNQSDRALDSDQARDLFGVDGSGVSIGILSDSFNSLGGYASDIATGDLPSNVNVLRDIANGSDEGRAMAQLIADIAPAASLNFRTAFGGIADFATGILELASAGSQIIVDDVIYLAEPMFQDGIIAQAVNQVVSDGVTYFSSAGNSGRNSYESSFRDSGQRFRIDGVDVGVLHDFNPGSGVDVTQQIRLNAGQTATFSFQWDQPFFSVGGEGSQSDYDIYVLAGNQIVSSSRTNNIGGDAVELLSFTNNGQFGTSEFNVVISRVSGPAATQMKYVVFGGSLDILEYDTESSTSYGHANAASAIPVGAAFFGNTPNFGAPVPVLQSFSSAVGTPILFDASGNRLAQPDIRERLLVGTDGGNTTFFGADIAFDNDAFPNFFGTSAAAPNVAAVAALMLQVNDSLTPSDVFEVLVNSTIDIGQTGYDADSGFGLVDALEAVKAAEERLTPKDVPSGSIVNGSFEQQLEGWIALGDVSIVNSAFGVAIPVGLSQARLTTRDASGGNQSQAAIETFLGLSDGRLEPVAPSNAISGSALRQTVDVKEGDTLTLKATFLTSEATPTPTFNDFAFFSVSGANTQDVLLVGDTRSSGFRASATSFNEETSQIELTYKFKSSGSFLIGFGLLDSEDAVVDSALLLDAISINENLGSNDRNDDPLVINNGSFESGLSFWAGVGDLSTAGNKFGVSPTAGSSQLILTTSNEEGGNRSAAEIADSLGIQSAALPNQATGGSAASQTITVGAGTKIAFEFSFLTNEAANSIAFNDFAFFAVSGSDNSEVFVLGDTFDDNLANSPMEFRNRLNGTFEFEFQNAGTYVTGFGVSDAGDLLFDSALSVDNIRIIAPQVIPQATLNNQLVTNDIDNSLLTDADSILQYSFLNLPVTVSDLIKVGPFEAGQLLSLLPAEPYLSDLAEPEGTDQAFTSNVDKVFDEIADDYLPYSFLGKSVKASDIIQAGPFGPGQFIGLLPASPFLNNVNASNPDETDEALLSILEGECFTGKSHI